MIKKKNFYRCYNLFLFIYSFMILIAFLIDSPSEILYGLKNIIITPDILITDYVAIGGIGATLVNAALTSIFSILILIYIGIKPNGSTIMSIWLMTGFSFFGKNIVNIWPVMIGVWLFAKYQKEPILNYSLIMILSTTLAPTVTQFNFISSIHPFIGFLIGALIGVFTGFILTPIASHCIIAHSGYNLYNIGFAGGLVAMMLMSIFRNIGIDFETTLIWNSGNNLIFTIILFIIGLAFIIMGIYFGDNHLSNLKKLTSQNGRLISDFYILYGDASFINMGVLCIFSTSLVLLIGGDLNGPTIGGIFTIMGFGCFGKHLKNIIPILIGAILAGTLNSESINSPSLILPILFSTCLAPISGKFGPLIGVLAGFLHVNIVINIGYLHGGMNLYNNGLAGGFVAMILIPLLTTFKEEVKFNEI
ncbi:MAG: DUF1576 domain-containing protein [Clostridium sp.]